MNKKGFTLVELLAVIVLISIITVIAVPMVQSANKKTKEKILNSKITYAKESVLSWSRDNENCFVSDSAINCIIGLNNGCTVSSNQISCILTYKKIVDNNLMKYDKIVNGEKVVVNPVTNESMNNREVKLTYDKVKRTFKVEDVEE